MTEETEIKQANPRQAQLQEPLIPDCCNIGILIRILLAVNFVFLLALLARGQGFAFNLQEFVETSMLIEAICLVSLLVLCGFRRMVERQEAAAWMQRLVCGTVPAIVCFFFLIGLMSVEWFAFSFPRLHLGFSVLLCFILGLAVQHYFELRTKAFSPALGEAQLQALQARIRPHFLFNSLNAVLSLIRTEPRRAETALEDLADLFRVLMRDTRKLTTLSDEIRLCKQYLDIEKIRLGDRLQVEWIIEHLSEHTLHNSKMPALLLQPLLENAVHYGVEPVADAAVIRIEITKKLDKIEMRVINPYHVHAQMPKGNHMALENIRQRLSLLYDIEAQLLDHIVDGRFEVRLSFPDRS